MPKTAQLTITDEDNIPTDIVVFYVVIFYLIALDTEALDIVSFFIVTISAYVFKAALTLLLLIY